MDLIAWEDYILANEKATHSYYRYKDSVDARYGDEDNDALLALRREHARHQRVVDSA